MPQEMPGWRAQAATCAACHGQDGATAIDPSYPNLAGQVQSICTANCKCFNPERDAPMTAQLIGKSGSVICRIWRLTTRACPPRLARRKEDGEIKVPRYIKAALPRKESQLAPLVMALADWVTTRRASHALVDNPLTIQLLS